MGVLDRAIPPIRRVLQRAPQGALGIAAAQQLPDLLAQGHDLGVRDGREGGVQCGRVEVGGRVRVEGIDVDGAPVLREGGRGVVLDDGHGGLESEG